MYVPTAFGEQDEARIGAFLDANDFAILVSDRDGEPFATHVPLLFDRGRGPKGSLLGHMARANPHWRAFGDREALAIFAGPHCYISPRWYESHPSVPTWNYAAVHVYGTPRLMEEEVEVRGLLSRMVARYEGTGEGAWSMDGLPEAYVAGMRRGIVAFEIPVLRIEAKFKLSQNRSAADRGRVIAALEDGANPADAAVAALMRAREPMDA